MNRTLGVLILVAGLCPPSAAWAQEEAADPESSVVQVCESLLEEFAGVVDEELGDFLCRWLGDEGPVEEILTNPDLLNNIVGTVTDKHPIGRFLRDINFKFKVFDTEGRGSPAAALGFEYAFDKSIENWTSRATHPLGLNFNFFGNGNVAFDRLINPNDFLQTGFKLHAFQFRSKANTISVDTTAADALQLAVLRAAAVEGTPEEIDASPEWQSFKKLFMETYLSKLDTDLFWDVAGHFSLESNQDFSLTQLAYGAELGIVLRAWNPDAALSKVNFFDYPFAVLRVLTGLDQQFTPSGRSVPSVLLGIDLVDPTDNELRRAAVGDEDAFARFHAELALRSRVARVVGDVVWFSASWRYYREIDADAAIKSANLDEHSYLAISLEFPLGIDVTYATGKLPLDQASNEVWQLGYKLTFR